MELPGIGKLRRAGEVLRNDGDGSAAPLVAGASEVWSAMFDLPAWPRALRDHAVALQTSLFRYGPIRMTVDRMVEPERLQLRRDLLAFIDDAERIGGPAPPVTEGRPPAA